MIKTTIFPQNIKLINAEDIQDVCVMVSTTESKLHLLVLSSSFIFTLGFLR